MIPKELVFHEDTYAIFLAVKKEDINLNSVEHFAIAENLLPKQEFHITIIGRKIGELLAKSKVDYATVKTLAENINWSFTLNKEFYFFTKAYISEDGIEEKRSSIIQTVELSGLSNFYIKLNQLTGQDFSVPFPHITLFTNSTLKNNQFQGIGIYSKKDMEDLHPSQLMVS